MTTRWNGNLVAGAAAECHGVLVGWSGRGDLTQGALFAIADAAGIPRAWCPRAKDAAVQLTRAVRAAAGSLYNAEQARRDGESDWSSRWMLVSRTVAGDLAPTAGAAYGEIALVVTLYDTASGPELVFDSAHTTLIEKVSTEFHARIASARYVAADVTKWLGEILRFRMDAVRYGGNWYVPRNRRAIAESICETLRESGWGTDWITPALPIATSTQLALGVCIALEKEVDDVIKDLVAARKEARDTDREDIGTRAAETFMVRLRGVGERVIAYSFHLGPELESTVRNRIHDAMVELDTVLGGVSFESEWGKVIEARNAKGGVLN